MSQAWVAFTVEVDNLFEERMPHRTARDRSGSGPWLASHAMWWNCMRYVDEQGLSLGELKSLTRPRTNLDGMRRWGCVTLDPGPGSTRGDSKNTSVRPTKGTVLRATANGVTARAVWEPLAAEVERRWGDRMGSVPAMASACGTGSALGRAARDTYHRVVHEIESRWRKRFGADPISRLRAVLELVVAAMWAVPS
jgi:hypothetical protein